MNFKLPLNLRDDFASFKDGRSAPPLKHKTFWIKIVTWIQKKEEENLIFVLQKCTRKFNTETKMLQTSDMYKLASIGSCTTMNFQNNFTKKKKI